MDSPTALGLALLIPLVTMPGLILLRRRPNAREALSLTAGLLLLLVLLPLWPRVLAGERPELLLVQMLPQVPLMLRLEPLGMIFALIAALLWPINSLYSIGYMRANGEANQTRFYVCFAAAIAGAMGVALAGNLLTLFVFYEVLTLSTYPLVTHKGDADARRGGRVYLGVLLGTSMALLLMAILWTWVLAGSLDFQPGGLLAGHLAGPLVGLLLLLYMLGIGKAALMPVHRWLPAAMVAPTPVSALLHAVAVVKAGVFTVVKVVVYVFGMDTLSSEPGTGWLLYLAGFTILAASVVALRQDNLKRRLAYSTISQLSYVVLAAAIMTPLSIMAAALHIAAHAFGKITLFFAAGSVYTAAHKTRVSELDGIGWRMPWTMGAFAIGALSMVGVPPAAGFVSKWYLVAGAWQAQSWLAMAVVLLSTLLNAAYFLPIVYRAFRPGGPAAGCSEGIAEAPLPMVLALSGTALLTLAFFGFSGMAEDLAMALAGGAP
jgi:multicomponent Na+:H+ antiporter subunit D